MKSLEAVDQTLAGMAVGREGGGMQQALQGFVRVPSPFLSSLELPPLPLSPPFLLLPLHPPLPLRLCLILFPPLLLRLVPHLLSRLSIPLSLFPVLSLCHPYPPPCSFGYPCPYCLPLCFSSPPCLFRLSLVLLDCPYHQHDPGRCQKLLVDSGR
ncbi:unnamed protein product [Closterium sp. Naga37s-1]|nr:unnamed protein product [Closterium sp. Naga37s-1]